MKKFGFVLLALSLVQCTSSAPEGVATAPRAATTVKLDFLHQPLPEIPLPNDIATVYDASSATQRRINASMVAPTGFEQSTRRLIDSLDGWGTFQPITIPFTGPIDVNSVIAGHRDEHYDLANDVVYVINIDRRSPDFGKPVYLDVGNGNYPVTLESRSGFWDNDARAGIMSLVFEEVDEDTNHNGVLDPGEDTDADGVLDKPNYLPGRHPAADDLAGRADASMSFYERETNTLILRPMEPMHERTVYAVIVTKRIKDINGESVGSPYPTINHTAQTEALKVLPEVLPAGLKMEDVAFAFSFTTQTVQTAWKSVRDGLYGYGVQHKLKDDYPAEVTELLPLRDESAFPEATKLHLLYGENWSQAIRIIGPALLGLDTNSAQYRTLIDAYKYVDYFVVGSYDSPQLFPKVDANGKPLLLNDQSWPPDLDRLVAPARREKVYFTLAVPRKEVSVRGQGKPAPVAFLGHGYTGNRFDGIQFAGYFARHGLATLAIDGPTHGLSIDPDQQALASQLLGQLGLSNLVDAVFTGRAADLDGDGIVDSGADFWTSYLFHTRDLVRQYMLDLSQLARIVHSFDGHRTWDFNISDGNHQSLAGDFDGDGQIDIGGDAPIVMTGGSLGGIMSMIAGGAEPLFTTIAPISGGAGYGDIAIRSVQGGVVEAFILRVLGPLYVGTIDANGDMPMRTIIPNLNNLGRVDIGKIAGIQPGDTLLAENLRNGAHGCGQVDAQGRVRASLESDRGDAIKLTFYKGPQLVPGTECHLQPGAQVRGTLDKFGVDFTYQAKPFKTGEPLVALEDGLGLPRATPDLRRMTAFAQTITDPGDPISYARSLQLEPIVFATGEKTGAHAAISTSQGDMNVPASSGLTYARAAGLVDYLHDDPRYGKPLNQVLLDTYTAEAVDTLARFTDASGAGVHLDVDHLSLGDTDIWGPQYPRLDPPLRVGFGKPDRLGGASVALFPLVNAHGQHGFSSPGSMLDDFRKKCRAECPQGQTGDPCGCAATPAFDIGTFMINVFAEFAVKDGKEIDLRLCNGHNDCPETPPAPPARPASVLD